MKIKYSTSSGRTKLPAIGFVHKKVAPKIERVQDVDFPAVVIRGAKVKKVLRRVVSSPIFGLVVELSPKPISNMLDYIKRKLSEPSTSRGLTGLLGAMGYALNPEYLEVIIAISVAVMALIEMVRDEERLIITLEEGDDEPTEG